MTDHWFKVWRDKYGFTQEQAAQELLFSHDTVSRVENGAKPRNIHFLELACNYYDDDILKFKKIMKKYS